MVEQRTLNPKRVGSNPTGPTRMQRHLKHCIVAFTRLIAVGLASILLGAVYWREASERHWTVPFPWLARVARVDGEAAYDLAMLFSLAIFFVAGLATYLALAWISRSHANRRKGLAQGR